MLPADITPVLRELIVAAAPDPDQAAPVAACDVDEPLDHVVPFSSIIALGVVVAVEDHFRIRITRDMMARAAADGYTLRALAQVIAGALAAPGAEPRPEPAGALATRGDRP